MQENVFIEINCASLYFIFKSKYKTLKNGNKIYKRRLEWESVIADCSDYLLCAVISESEDRVICHTTVDNKMSKEEQEVNAKLIAAAPDMFNALKDLYDDREVWSDLFESQQDFICRVLNKATGSSFFKH